MSRFRMSLVLVILAAAFVSPSVVAEEKSFLLAIGDPERRDREVGLELDAIVDTRTGDMLSPAELAARLEGVGIVFVGEVHTDDHSHQMQMRLIEELHRAGRQVHIGLEMFPYTRQPEIDLWRQGHLTEAGFLEIADWYANWSYDWLYYRDIFLFAREHRLGLVAVNAPRDVVKAVRKKGFEELTEEEAAHIPTDIVEATDEYRQLFQSHFDGESMHFDLSPEQWEGMYAAQMTWDATMGHHAVLAMKENAGSEAIMVVLIGAGHVEYDLGIERQAAQWYDGKMASLIGVPIRDDDGDPVEKVQASYADFVWGLPAATDPIHPFLGLSTMPSPGEPYRRVIHVSEESVAARAGFQNGDVLLAMDGVALDKKGVLARQVAALHWGDEATFQIRRDDQEMELIVPFRRTPPEASEETDT